MNSIKINPLAMKAATNVKTVADQLIEIVNMNYEISEEYFRQFEQTFSSTPETKQNKNKKAYLDDDLVSISHLSLSLLLMILSMTLA